MKFRGQLDEVRISVPERSADWIGAQYKTLTGDLITWGSQP